MNEQDETGGTQMRLGAVEAFAGSALAAPLAYLAYQDISQLGWVAVGLVFLAVLLIWDGMGRFNSGWSLDA